MNLCLSIAQKPETMYVLPDIIRDKTGEEMALDPSGGVDVRYISVHGSGQIQHGL